MEDIGQGLAKILQQKKMYQRYQELVQTLLQDAEVRAFINAHQEQLTEEGIQKSYAKLYEFVQEKKKFQANDPTMIAPGYEPQLILHAHAIDVTYVPTQALLTQQKEAQIRQRVTAMHIAKDIRQASLRAFDRTTEGRDAAFSKAMRFIRTYPEQPKTFHQGLYLQGRFGVGKSYLLGAIANRLAELGFLTTFVHFPTFAVEMKAAIGQDKVSEKLALIKKAEILMLDDIGAESMTSWIRDDILGVILQYRMQEQLATFFSSNLDWQALEAHLTVSQRGENEPLKAKRVMERIRYLAEEVSMTGSDRRNPQGKSND